MNKLLAAALLGWFAMPALAQSAKSAVQVGQITNLGKASTIVDQNTYEGGWVPVLRTQIRTSSQKDLIFGVSLESALVTDTTVASSKYRLDTSTAEAAVEVRVKLDGSIIVDPGEVVLARRLQSLSAKFDGFSCVDQAGVDPVTGLPTAPDGIIQYTECTWTDEELRMLQETMNANAFFFAADDVGVGTHAVVVEARLRVSSASQAGAASAAAWVGKGSFTVEEVRLVKGVDITL